MDKEVIKAFYDKVGKQESMYSQEEKRFAPVEPTIQIAELAMERDAKQILDIGCGMGTSIITLASKLPDDVQFVGIDINESMIKKAKEQISQIEGLEHRVRFIVADAEEVPCQSGMFDFVYSECVFNLISNRNNMLEEINRVLKKYGLLVYSDFIAYKEVPSSVSSNAELSCGCQSGSHTLSGNIKALELNYFSKIECINCEEAQKARNTYLESNHAAIKEANDLLKSKYKEEVKFLEEEVAYYLIQAQKKADIPDHGGCCCC